MNCFLLTIFQTFFNRARARLEKDIFIVRERVHELRIFFWQFFTTFVFAFFELLILLIVNFVVREIGL